jgi:hypothetical protein
MPGAGGGKELETKKLFMSNDSLCKGSFVCMNGVLVADEPSVGQL